MKLLLKNFDIHLSEFKNISENKGYFVDAEIISRVPYIVKGIRQYLNLNQEDIAKITNTSQSSISKIESGKLEFSALEWVLFCDYFHINGDCLIKGYVWLDQSKFQVSDSQISRRANIKLDYQDSATVLVKWLTPIIELIRETSGDKEYQRFLNKLEIGPEYFCVLNNRVNWKCIQDIFTWIHAHKDMIANRQ